MTMREEFEAWAATEYKYSLTRYFTDLRYDDDDTEEAWDAWQASRNSLVIDLPTPISFGHDWLMNGKDVEDAIHATGARTK